MGSKYWLHPLQLFWSVSGSHVELRRGEERSGFGVFVGDIIAVSGGGGGGCGCFGFAIGVDGERLMSSGSGGRAAIVGE